MEQSRTARASLARSVYSAMVESDANAGVVMDSAKIEGLTIAVARPAQPVSRERPPVLFVHGMFGGAWYFERYQRFFARRGYSSYAVNLRGHHDSRLVEDLGKVSLSDYVEDARTVARHLGRPIVIGHSMGGLIAQKLAEADVVAAAVLVAAAPPRWITPATPMLLRKHLKHAWRILRQKSVRGAPEDHLALSLNRMPPDEAVVALSRLVPESGKAALQLSLSTVAVDAREVRCPMLGVVGLDDRFIVPRVMRSIARKFDMRLVELPGYAHFIITEPGWEKPAGIIADWLDETVRDRGVAGLGQRQL